MNKTALSLFVILAAGTALTSCKKDYTCACKLHIPGDTAAGVNIDPVDSTYAIQYNDFKKKDARANCDKVESDNNTTAAQVAKGSVTCDLK